MYMPTWENFALRAGEYMLSGAISIFGYYIDERIAGIIVVDKKAGATPEIVGIAVGPEYRKQGVGKRLIIYACKALDTREIMVETDDDAVAFYRRCGFEAEEFMKMFDSGEYKRYKCVLYMESLNIDPDYPS